MNYQMKMCVTACIACITIDSVMRMKKKKLSTSFFRRMQIKNKEDKDV